ncbi:metallophosphoesterase [Halobacillus litoralis]|uniref:metallophosphoesterase n=1 Tax=Halobacillus litoralis TaxID=45668 RepID=UPI002490FFF2|nr:metallophosphoesterase [Halobacillus litoralis]
MLWVLFLLLVASISLILFMWFSAHHDHLDVREMTDASLGEIDELRLFFISDIHKRKLREETLSKVGMVDVVIIGGDLVDKRTSSERLEKNLTLLKRWKAPVYFIPGNNDHEFETGALLEVLQEHGILPLSNVDETVEVSQGKNIVLSGLDPYFLQPRRNASYINDLDGYQVLCVHDPYVFARMNKEDQDRFNLVLSGHTHGGQIRIFGMGPYERGGWSRNGARTILVSEGYGTSLFSLRLGTKAECHVIHVKSGKK